MDIAIAVQSRDDQACRDPEILLAVIPGRQAYGAPAYLAIFRKPSKPVCNSGLEIDTPDGQPGDYVFTAFKIFRSSGDQGLGPY